MGLIDADALIEAMRKKEEEYESAMRTPNWWTAFDVVENQPTAYDVDKVVEELDEEKQRLRRLRNDCIALSDSEVIAIEEKAYNFAIKLVRKGGVE